MIEESKVYDDLRAHLDTFPIGYPSTKSGVEIEILKYFFTPEEALIATKLNFSWSRNLEPLSVIHERLKNTDLSISLEDLETQLDNMVKKGLIHFRQDDEKGKSYANAQFIIGIYEFQVNKLTKEFIKKYFTYLKEGFGLEVFGTKIPQFRTVPVEESITIEHNVATYDELRNVIESVEEPLVLMNCVCRQAMDMYDRPCKMTDRREVCLGFGPLAHQAIEFGWGRSVSREEALDVLRKNEEEGLILQAGNALRPDFICSCCGCCCPIIMGAKNFPRPVQFFHANYVAEIDREACTGCGACIERCQMEAIRMVKECSKVNWKKCIGCGNCVAVCPEEAIQLRKKEQEIEPYPTMDDMYDGILEKKIELRAKK